MIHGTKKIRETTQSTSRVFNGRVDGREIWKWEHYFDVYQQHLARFRDTDAGVLEIGVYSGGSLDMWRDYFGPTATIYGVDIEPSCRIYEDAQTKIFIGDQADMNFWTRFCAEVPVLDAVIDDGGHLPEQHIASLEALFSHLRPGGVYICEDVHGSGNRFAAHVFAMADRLNAFAKVQVNPDDNDRRIVCPAETMQSMVHSISLYPFMAVIQKTDTPVAEFVAPKHGTSWQPFLR